jgi:hypothetical protein
MVAFSRSLDVDIPVIVLEVVMISPMSSLCRAVPRDDKLNLDVMHRSGWRLAGGNESYVRAVSALLNCSKCFLIMMIC